MNNAKGIVFKYGDNVDTDVIIPARYLNSSDPKELATHCMEDIDKDFVKNVKEGDIISINIPEYSIELKVDEAELEEAVDVQIKNLEAQLMNQGLTLQMYCQFMNTSVEELRKDSYPAAEVALRNHAAVLKIAELEKLEPTSEEISQALAMICRQNNLTMDQLKEFYDAEFEVAVMKSILTNKVMRLIRDAADITVTQ